MPWTANEKTLPWLHLLGSIGVVLLVTLTLAGYFSWQNLHEQDAAFARIEHASQVQQRDRLKAEMTSALGYLEFVRSRTEDLLRASLAEEVDSTMQMVESIYTRETPRRPASEVKTLILEALRPIRFYQGRGYYFVDDMQGQFLLLPTAPQFEGKNGWDNQDDQGHYIMRGLIEAARKPAGQGYSRYRWYIPGQPKTMGDKIAYVRHFAPFEWVIGTGDYTYHWENIQKREAIARLRALRFGQTGHFGLLDTEGQPLLVPAGNAQEKTDAEPATSAEMQQVLQRVHNLAHEGGGYISYEWPHPVTQAPVKQTAYVSSYGPWGWTLMASVSDVDWQASLTQERQRLQESNTLRYGQWLTALAVALALGLLSSLAFNRWLKRLFDRYDQERSRTEADLRIAATAFEAQEGIFVTDAYHQILRVNQAFIDITGYQPAEVVGKPSSILHSDQGHHDRHFYDTLYTSLAETGSWHGEIWNRRKNGEVFPEWLAISAVKTMQGAISHYVHTLTDITQRKAAAEQIHHLAFFDPLTQLPNRRLFLDRLRQALANSQRTQREGALIFIDLDHFKLINDSLGHDKGDLVLQEVARRLTVCAREGDTVARLGGDEFVVMLEELSALPQEAAAECEVLGHKILTALAQPYDLLEQSMESTCSIGVALFTDQHASPEDLMKRADVAMYQAKEAGRNAIRFFNPEMHATVMQRLALERDLRTALRDQQFMLVYQPQVAGDGKVIGAEALVRWRHPERGMVSPAAFIPLAEDTGLILPLGQWILHTACLQLATWAQSPETDHLTLAVNISELQLRQPDFVQQVIETLTQTGAPSNRLKLELTESLLLENTEDAIAKMEALQAHGIGFSLDDFGTGYSSLAYLKRLPLDQLKIDQSFVHEIASEAKDAAIVQAIVALAQNLQLSVIAEGVETTEQQDCLKRHGCHNFQGYLFHKPVPIEEFRVT